MLPEVNRRRLYEKKGFASIFEFAAKLAGLSNDQVRLALNLERRFEDKPALKQMLVEGKTSLHKLTRIASIATVENEQELAQKVNVLSKNALATLARDERVGSKSLPGQTLKFDLSDEVIEQLNLLHAQGKDVNVLLMELLKEREEKIVTKKEELSLKAMKTDSHYVSAEVRHLLKEEYGEKCSIKWCSRPAAVIHHSQRFGLAHTHDPKFLAPLCHEHHQIAHSIDARVQSYSHSIVAGGLFVMS